MKSTDILRKYTDGQLSLQEANAALKECRAGVHLDPQRNYIHPGEKDLYGLLDTGTGTLDKVRPQRQTEQCRLRRNEGSLSL